MKPFFFGNLKEPLFGIFHSVQSNVLKDCGVVICAPIGHEHIRTHRALRQLAIALSSEGFPVLRFDYFGVGDSAGESGYGGISRWTDDILLAVDELVTISCVKNILLIGLRIGATLAFNVKINKNIGKQLILWDPVISGKCFFDDLKKIHASLYVDKIMSIDSEELVGFQYPIKLQKNILAADMLKMSLDDSVKYVNLLISSDNSFCSSFRNHLRESNVFCTTDYYTDPAEWDKPDAIDKNFIGVNAIGKIVRIVSEKNND